MENEALNSSWLVLMLLVYRLLADQTAGMKPTLTS